MYGMIRMVGLRIVGTGLVNTGQIMSTNFKRDKRSAKKGAVFILWCELPIDLNMHYVVITTRLLCEDFTRKR